MAPVTEPYPQAVRVGQLLFFSGLSGINPETGRVATRVDEIDPELRKIIKTGRYKTDSAEEPFKAQRSSRWCFH